MNRQPVNHHQILSFLTDGLPSHSTPQPLPSHQGFTKATLKVDKCHSICRKNDDWSKFQKLAYGRLLLSYLSKNMNVGSCFLQHLSQLINRAPRQIYSFHRKMQSQFKSCSKIVMHLLKSQAGQLRQKKKEKQLFFEENADFCDFLACLNQVQEINFSSREYLQQIRLVQISLDHYEQDFDEDCEIYDLLDDQQEEKEENTNGSIDSLQDAIVEEYLM